MTLLWLREKTKFYIWSELHSIVAVKCKYIFQFQEDRQPREWRKIFHSVHDRSENISEWTLMELATLWKKHLEEISFDLLLVSFVYHTRNFLGNWAEKNYSFTKLPENKICFLRIKYVFWEQYIHTMMFVKCHFWGICFLVTWGLTLYVDENDQFSKMLI